MIVESNEQEYRCKTCTESFKSVDELYKHQSEQGTYIYALTCMHLHTCTYMHVLTCMHLHACTYMYALTLMEKAPLLFIHQQQIVLKTKTPFT